MTQSVSEVKKRPAPTVSFRAIVTDGVHLTRNEARILAAIAVFTRLRTYSPTLRELATLQHFSLTCIASSVKSLEAKGCIAKRPPKRKRTIEIIVPLKVEIEL